jgi:hypothetical protein
MATSHSTNVLQPFAEQHGKWNANETNVRVTRVIDRALIECRDRMDDALRGLERTPPVEPDMSTLEKGLAKLATFAKQLNVPDELVEGELRALNEAYVAAKTEARAAHPDAGEAGKKATRAISNAYATAQARAALIKEALEPHLAKKRPEAAKPKDSDTAEIDLAPDAKPKEGDTGDATHVGGPADENIDFGDFEDFGDLDTIDSDDESAGEPVILPMPAETKASPPAPKKKQS